MPAIFPYLPRQISFLNPDKAAFQAVLPYSLLHQRHTDTVLPNLIALKILQYTGICGTVPYGYKEGTGSCELAHKRDTLFLF